MPTKKKPSEAVSDWSKGITKAVKDKSFAKGVDRAAKAGTWEANALKAGDESWKSGVDKAAEQGAFSAGVKGKGDKWATETKGNAEKWAEEVEKPAVKAKFETAIANVMSGIDACATEVKESQVREFLDNVNPALPADKQMTMSEARGYLLRNCLQKKKGTLKAE